jgi:hypothetical protein
LSAIDIAGKHRSDKAALVLLDFYQANFSLVAKYFNDVGDDFDHDVYQEDCN